MLNRLSPFAPAGCLLYADEKAGFSHLGEWAGEHGSEAWHEMELRL